MSSLVLTIKSDRSLAYLQDRLQLSGRPHVGKRELQNFIQAQGPIYTGSIDVQTASADPVRASATFTLASVVENEAVTIGKTTLTFKDSPAGENQVQTGGADDAADAVVLAAAINAHSVLSKIVTASAAAAVVTVTARVPGVIGNEIIFSETGTTITATGSGYLASGAGGSEDTAVTYSFD